MSRRPVALIVGASKGIGRAAALDLARHGFDLVLVSRPGQSDAVPAESLDGAVEAAERYGAAVRPLRYDISSRSDAARIVDDAAAAFGRIDLSLLSANWIDHSPGGSYASQLADMRVESMIGHIETTVIHHLIIIRDLVRVTARQTAGMIINITQNRLTNSGVPTLPAVLEPPLMERLRVGDTYGAPMVPIARGATERIAPALRAEMANVGGTILTLDPGLTLSKEGLVELYAANDRYEGKYSVSAAHSVLVGARAVTYLATCHNPAVYNGMFVDAEDLVRTFGLMADNEIAPAAGEGVQVVDSLPALQSGESE